MVGLEDYMERLAEYFQDVYNVLPMPKDWPVELRWLRIPPIREDPPSYQEVKRVIYELKRG